MKCINKFRIIRLSCICSVVALLVTGCGTTEVQLNNEYDAYSLENNIFEDDSLDSVDYFAENICVTDRTNIGTEETDAWVAHGAGVFNLTTKEVLYSQNIYDKLYPASTTKVLTAYIILRDCNLNSVVTVSKEAATQEADSSVAGLKEGDNITVRDLLYGLILPSGNDAAEALAEFHSGSIAEFANVMNETALELGATGSHFVNPSGLPDTNHYTTVYDMYLIFKTAIEDPQFVEIINTKSKAVTYTAANGKTINKTYNNTNRYFTGYATIPSGFTLIGGKTGTTSAAKYCLVLYTQNEAGEDIISIVFKADCRQNLYWLMNQILRGFAK